MSNITCCQECFSPHQFHQAAPSLVLAMIHYNYKMHQFLNFWFIFIFVLWTVIDFHCSPVIIVDIITIITIKKGFSDILIIDSFLKRSRISLVVNKPILSDKQRQLIIVSLQILYICQTHHYPVSENSTWKYLMHLKKCSRADLNLDYIVKQKFCLHLEIWKNFMQCLTLKLEISIW